MSEFDPLGALGALSAAGVRFVVVGALAARLAGAPVVTADLDVCPAEEPENLARLAGVLVEMEAEVRGAPGVRVPGDGRPLATSQVWNLSTRHGDLDLILRPAGTDGFAELAATAVRVDLGGLQVLVASLCDVVRSKRAAGRPRDLGQLPLLEETLREQKERGEG